MLHLLNQANFDWRVWNIYIYSIIILLYSKCYLLFIHAKMMTVKKISACHCRYVRCSLDKLFWVVFTKSSLLYSSVVYQKHLISKKFRHTEKDIKSHERVCSCNQSDFWMLTLLWTLRPRKGRFPVCFFFKLQFDVISIFFPQDFHWHLFKALTPHTMSKVF